MSSKRSATGRRLRVLTNAVLLRLRLRCREVARGDGGKYDVAMSL
jgi:hypothetical protein